MLYDIGLTVTYFYDRPAVGGRHLLRLAPADLAGAQEAVGKAIGWGEARGTGDMIVHIDHMRVAALFDGARIDLVLAGAGTRQAAGRHKRHRRDHDKAHGQARRRTGRRKLHCHLSKLLFL